MSVTKIPTTLRTRVLDRDGRRCLWCGRDSSDGIKLHIDHVLSEMFNGKTSYYNLGTLCNECNNGKSSDYYGSLLLTTILSKAPEIFDMISDREMEHGKHPETGGYYDGILHEVSLSFFKGDDRYRREKISSYYLIHGGDLRSMVDPDTQIRIIDKRTKAILQLKERVRDFMFENHGYLERIEDGKLVFRVKQPITEDIKMNQPQH